MTDKLLSDWLKASQLQVQGHSQGHEPRTRPIRGLSRQGKREELVILGELLVLPWFLLPGNPRLAHIFAWRGFDFTDTLCGLVFSPSSIRSSVELSLGS